MALGAAPARDFTWVPILSGPAPTWTDVTAGPLSEAGTGYGIAWADYDGDGDHDLCLAQMYSTPPIRLFRNDGAGVFMDVTAYPLTLAAPSRLTAWADADNDGDLDFLRGHYIEQNYLFRNDGVAFSIPNCDMCQKGEGGAAWGDYDGDGELDMAFVRLGGIVFLYHNTGGLHFTLATTLGGIGSVRAPIWIDYDGDGDLDLYLVAGGSDRLLRNDSASFVDVTPAVLADPDDGNTAAWGDYDNDGDPDVYLPKLSGTNRLLRNDGGGAFTDVTASALVGLDGHSQDASWADVDNDGDLDLFVVRSTSANVLFLNDGVAFASAGNSALNGTGTRHSAAWTDFDADGGLDVYVASDSTRVRLLRNELPPGSSHWLHVDLIGSPSNRSGVGARIHVKSGGIWRMQDVSGGAGFSQGSLTAEFGLGSATLADSVVVHWPSGQLQTRIEVPGDQRTRFQRS